MIETYLGLQIKVGNKWVDCLVIGDVEDGFLAIKVNEVPKSSLKMTKIKTK